MGGKDRKRQQPQSRAALRGMAASGAYWMLGSSIGTFAIQFFTTILLARLFTPVEFGLITSILVGVSFADILWQAGVGQAIIQKSRISDSLVRTAHRLTLGLGTLVGILAAATAGPLGAALGIQPSLLAIISLVFPLSAIGSVPFALLQRRLVFGVILLKEVLELATYGLVGVVAGLYGAGLEGLIAAVLARTLVGATVPWIYARVSRGPGAGFSTVRELLHFGAGASLASLLNTAARNADYVVVLRVMDPLALGLYSRAYQLVTIPANVIGQVVDRVLFPALSRIQADGHALGRVYVTASAALAALYFPGGVILYFLADDIVLLLLGEEWRAVADPFRALALFLFFRVAYKLGEPLAKALGAVFSSAALQGLYTLLVVICAFVGSNFGLVGVALGVGVALALNCFAVNVFVHRLVRFELVPMLIGVGVPAVVQVAAAGLSWYVVGVIEQYSLGASGDWVRWGLLALIQGCALIVVVAMWPRKIRTAVFQMVVIGKGSVTGRP